MKIANRLLLAVVPAIVGLFTVAALAYWGQRYRQAPEWVLLVATVAALGSLAVAWQNTRHVIRRIEQLAGPVDRDELDSIEAVVHRLSGAVAVAEADSRQREAAASERVQEYATLLAEAASAMTRQLEEVRLPIHILLEHHFGELNESQEEMLAGARAATEAAEVELGRLRDIASLDRGMLDIKRGQVRVGDLLRALRPQLQADGERAGVRFTLDVAPGLPRVAGDRIRLQQALELLLRHLIRHATPGAALGAVAAAAGQGVLVTVDQSPAPTLDADVALARRIILAHGGTLEYHDGQTSVALPATGPA